MVSAYVPRARPVPGHVPPALVREYSFWASPGMAPERGGDPHAALAALRDYPRIFFAPGNTFDGHGCWLLTRADDMRAVLQDGVTFSSARKLFSPLIGENWPLVPLEIDPPDHARYRSLLNPLLSPNRMTSMQAGIRDRAVRMIEALRPRGSCNYMDEFAFPFAVSVFLQFLGLPDTRMPEFIRWGNDVLHGGDLATRVAAANEMVGFLRELIALRRREPADDFATFVVQAQVDGRPLTDDETLGMAVLLFVAGLDTVAAALGFDFNYLARNPDAQERLRRNPALIPDAVEELLRLYPTVHMVRVATRDVELHGVQIKAGDRVSCPTMVANRDPEEFPDPDRVDFQRQPNRHVAFSYGPHRCVGSHLARREVVVGMEEWLARMPAFRIKESTAPLVHGGTVFGIEDLILAWD
jgi:cytochrome P450